MYQDKKLGNSHQFHANHIQIHKHIDITSHHEKPYHKFINHITYNNNLHTFLPICGAEVLA